MLSELMCLSNVGISFIIDGTHHKRDNNIKSNNSLAIADHNTAKSEEKGREGGEEKRRGGEKEKGMGEEEKVEGLSKICVYPMLASAL